jgi:hypothetical protein
MRRLKKTPQEIREARRARRDQLARGQGGIAQDDDDPVPADIHEFRYELARRIARFIGDRREAWRGCKEPSCRRQRSCVAPRIGCRNRPPSPPPDPTGKRTARVKAQIHRMLRERLEQEEGE